MSLPGSTLRRRKTNLQELVTSFDAFTKTKQEIKEEKSTSGGIVSAICFTIIGIICFGELNDFFFGDPEYEYKFSPDVAYDEKPKIELDMIVATPCTSLSVQMPDAFPDIDLMAEFDKDPTRFEFTEQELQYWNELKKAQGLVHPDASMFKGLEQMTFVRGGVEEGLARVAKEKQEEEEYAIEQDKKNDPEAYASQGRAAVILIGGNMNVFQIISSNSGKDEGTACRIHGRLAISKVRGDSIIIAIGKTNGVEAILEHMGGLPTKGNVSHRIGRLNFGPRIPGLVMPLAGTEQISESGRAEYRYFLKVVPTKIYHGLFGRSTSTFQYSVTSTKKIPKGDEHFHSAIVIHYDFAATLIEVRAVYTSAIQLLVRLCSVVGGVFATSAMLHSLFRSCFCFWFSKRQNLQSSTDLSHSSQLNQPYVPLVKNM
uniref:Endoplasmic reticulum-Golgi intermediate compartment protein 2 n=1 Tax=Syphacia muris TaxID=451379 RepID=A0A0N5AMK5_9BILA